MCAILFVLFRTDVSAPRSPGPLRSPRDTTLEVSSPLLLNHALPGRGSVQRLGGSAAALALDSVPALGPSRRNPVRARAQALLEVHCPWDVLASSLEALVLNRGSLLDLLTLSWGPPGGLRFPWGRPFRISVAFWLMSRDP